MQGRQGGEEVSTLLNLESPKPRVKVAGKVCEGYRGYFGDYECGYEPEITCEECVFVVGDGLGDYRKGKRPWAKKNSPKE